MIGFRHADRRLPFLWEGAGQPAGRWSDGSGDPVQHLADTSDGAWAEFLRHEEITSPPDLATVTRAIWAIEIPDARYGEPELPERVLTGGSDSYPACRTEAARLRAAGFDGLVALSAALLAGGAAGWRVDGGLRPGPPREGRTIVLFGNRPELVGWRTAEGRPHESLLEQVRPIAG